MQSYILTVLIGYIFGCFQASYILGKIVKKVDIRSLGNGNAGASNAVNTLGWKFGIVVALVDIGKATLSILIMKVLLQGSVRPEQLPFFLYLNGLFVILGHNYPFYMGFKGGKGTASLIGMLVAIDGRIALLCIIAILIVTIVTDYIALGTIGLLIVLVLSTLYFQYSIGCVIIALVIAAQSIYKHIPNIHNIRRGTESGLRKALKK
ncbi:glycerol-3-phosphate acyltransferase PlsY [Anaerosolibacter carboniphilus]|uniref:Glycerol-3-phosphate acyltransferase n=1 Tax=Anaerosolibacter carboniphilus TaxID=1417629 RepID=A0A841KW53_9FIRM|nr:glycerol-3-phosphate acyltransferase [Anaerosolibacter carboniphilus]MBB6214405.1 glycerol-3-phosphate acyltransferase PlsY [Anaerosolibacter carboniphilus]